MRQLVAGNWKMNGLGADLAELAAVRTGLAGVVCDVLVCPPATLIYRAIAEARDAFAIGGQNCHSEASGAFTGEVSAAMLKDAGAAWVILGHSERRHYNAETDTMVAAKAGAAWRSGLKTIICVGETLAQRDAGQAHGVCHSQITGSVPKEAMAANTVVAYEPIWAIGTGRTPSSDDIVAMHRHIRKCLVEQLGAAGKDVLILYGGSVKAANAPEILALPEVGGALVGGASLKAADFLPIAAAGR
ncbi:MAG TPA: triose-phosphate isomerase [Rhizomicrobium sp.]|jgi:triosephosphate isomerase|nr:triose-phosphate isomerase [Rhizomicrobium sp.]